MHPEFVCGCRTCCISAPVWHVVHTPIPLGIVSIWAIYIISWCHQIPMLCVIYVRGWGQEGKGPVFVPSLLAASGETLGRSDTKEVKAVRLDWESVMKCEAIVDNLWQDNAVQIQFSDFGSAGNQSQIQISEAQWLKTAGWKKVLAGWGGGGCGQSDFSVIPASQHCLELKCCQSAKSGLDKKKFRHKILKSCFFLFFFLFWKTGHNDQRWCFWGVFYLGWGLGFQPLESQPPGRVLLLEVVEMATLKLKVNFFEASHRGPMGWSACPGEGIRRVLAGHVTQTSGQRGASSPLWIFFPRGPRA